MQRAQIGEVVGWMGKGLAIVILFLMAIFIFVLNTNERFIRVETEVYWITIAVGCVSAMVVYLIGHALRSILVADNLSPRDNRSDQGV
jgi:hypothetical protein